MSTPKAPPGEEGGDEGGAEARRPGEGAEARRPGEGAEAGAGADEAGGGAAEAGGGAAEAGGGSKRSGAAQEPPRSPSTRWAIVRLVVVVAAIVAVFLAAGLADLLIFILALVACVILHELGHYLTAKWSHMKVTEFFIGFGPRLWSVRKGETEYGFKPIVVGAYVKIPGMTNLEQVDPADEPRTYRQKPFHRRILVASAGSIMHFVIAFVLAGAVALSVGVPTGTQVTVAGFTPWPGHRETAAQLAGMKPGDRVLSIDGKQVETTTALSKTIQAAKGGPVTLVVERGGRRRTLVVQPQAGHVVTTGKTKGEEVLGKGSGSGTGRTEWLIGIQTSLAPVFTPQDPWQGVAWAGDDVGNVTRLTVLGFGHAFSPGGLSSLFHQVTNTQAADKAAANPTKSNRILSVVEAARLATQAEAKGAYYFLSILIALNIALGLLNMLPMLPLDGGHVAIAVYERIRTRRGRPYYQADVAKLMPVAYAFMALLLVVVGSAVFLDIAHPLANPFG
ncbi:MAG: site-2 protease family protein [Actinomycetota bacterium]|nr:site-2 protease family protein [Actinomycetota bacterium]